jgi:hypothetical protein
MISLVRFKILRYGLVSAVGYLWVFLFINFFMNRLGNLQSSVIAYGSWYCVQFLLQKKFIFGAVSNDGLYTRYFLFLITNYILVLFLHNTIVWFSSNVNIAILLTAIVVFPIRYHVLNKWVYG